ncbi:MAG: serpin family protein [Spirochaetota bacterium]|nr:serpin family protein [Spirochaetota bacterium]
MRRMSKYLNLVVLLFILFCVRCSDESKSTDLPIIESPPFQIQRSSLNRDLSPDVSEGDFSELIDGNTQFVLDLYAQLQSEEGNLFYSPYSISIALAMTYAGARGNTEMEIAETLNFTLPQTRLHTAFNKLDLTLANSEGATENDFILSVANSLWGEQTYSFLEGFLDVLALNYGAAMYLLDFINNPDESRQIINTWIEDQTNGKITDFLKPGIVTKSTRLVLTNAVYFYGKWIYQFDEENTSTEIFSLLDESQVNVSMMKQEEYFSYADGEGYQAVELPYEGKDAGMLIIMPDAGTFETFEQNLDTQTLSDITNNLELRNIDLKMPKWEFKSEFSFKDTLKDMGMNDAFLPDTADFSGIDGSFDLFIGNVVHKAFVSVDEFGTEAAAATAVVFEFTSQPSEPVIIHINRPFIFLIRDFQTGTILFIGRVLNPAE